MNPNSTPRTVIVTGAGSGIGLAVARAFLERGDNVVLNGRTESKLNDAAVQLGHPDQIAIAPGDITHPQTGQQLIDIAVERFGASISSSTTQESSRPNRSPTTASKNSTPTSATCVARFSLPRPPPVRCAGTRVTLVE